MKKTAKPGMNYSEYWTFVRLVIVTNSEGICIQVQWLWQPEKCEWTWNALEELSEDVS